LGRFLLDEIKAPGARALFAAETVKVKRRPGCDVSSVVIRTGCREEEVACDRLLIAAGPWSPGISRALFPTARRDLPIHADTGSYSMLFRFPQITIKPDCRNKSVVLRSEGQHSLQLMMRDDGLVHAATVPPVTLDLGSAAANGRIERIGDDLRALEAEIQSLLSVPSEVVLRRACFSPVTESRLPIISQVPSAWLDSECNGIHDDERRSEVFVLGGHGYWGIAASLGSGKLMAQLMLGEKTDVDITQFSLESHSA